MDCLSMTVVNQCRWDASMKQSFPPNPPDTHVTHRGRAYVSITLEEDGDGLELIASVPI